MSAPSDQIDPRAYTWHFLSYYKYRFTFECDQEPQWRASYGGDPDQIYRYEVEGGPGRSWNEITEGTCTSDQDVADAHGGKHEFVYIWRQEHASPPPAETDVTVSEPYAVLELWVASGRFPRWAGATLIRHYSGAVIAEMILPITTPDLLAAASDWAREAGFALAGPWRLQWPVARADLVMSAEEAAVAYGSDEGAAITEPEPTA